MRRLAFSLIVVLITLLVVSSAGARPAFDDPPAVELAEDGTQPQEPSPSETTEEAAPETPSPIPTDAVETSVLRVVDGDTIEVEIAGEAFKLRYIGVNTPETVDPRRPVQYYGREASAANKRLVEGQTVYLEKDVSETDRYGRLLRYVYLPDGTMVNEELVRQGYAQSSSYPPDVRYQQRFRALEREAREAGRGLWAPAEQEPESPIEPSVPAPAPPAAQAPAPASPAAVSGEGGSYPCAADQIKGNRNSKIYHAPDQRDYEKTQANVQCFDTEREAEASGYRKAQR